MRGVDFFVIPDNDSIDTLRYDTYTTDAKVHLKITATDFNVDIKKLHSIIDTVRANTTHRSLLDELFTFAKETMENFTVKELKHIITFPNFEIASLFTKPKPVKRKQLSISDFTIDNSALHETTTVVNPPERPLTLNEVPKQPISQRQLKLPWDTKKNICDMEGMEKLKKTPNLPKVLVEWVNDITKEYSNATIEDREVRVKHLWDGFSKHCETLYENEKDVGLVRALVHTTLQKIDANICSLESPDRLIMQLSQSQQSSSSSRRRLFDDVEGDDPELLHELMSPSKVTRVTAKASPSHRSRLELEISPESNNVPIRQTLHGLISHPGDKKRSFAIDTLSNAIEAVPSANAQFKHFLWICVDPIGVARLGAKFEDTWTHFNGGVSTPECPKPRLRRLKNAYWTVMNSETDLLVDSESESTQIFFAAVYCSKTNGHYLSIASDIDDYLFEVLKFSQEMFDRTLFIPLKRDPKIWKETVIFICDSIRCGVGGSTGNNPDHETYRKCTEELSKVDGAAFQHLLKHCTTYNYITEDEIFNAIVRIGENLDHAEPSVVSSCKMFIAQNGHLTNIAKQAAIAVSWLLMRKMPFMYKNVGRVALKMAQSLYDAVFDKIGNFLDPLYNDDEYPENLGDNRGQLSSSIIFYTFVDLTTSKSDLMYVLHHNLVNPSELFNKIITHLCIAKKRNRHILLSGDHATGKSITASLLKDLFDGTTIILEGENSGQDWVLAEPNDQFQGLVHIEDVSYKKLQQYCVHLRALLDGEVVKMNKKFHKCKDNRWPPVITATNVPLRGPSKAPLDYVGDTLESYGKLDLIQQVPEYLSAKPKENLLDSRFLIQRYSAISMPIPLAMNSKRVTSLTKSDGLNFLWSRIFPDCHSAYGIMPTMWSPCEGDPNVLENHHPCCRLVLRGYYQRNCRPTECDETLCPHIACLETERVRKELLGYFFSTGDIENVRQAMYINNRIPEKQASCSEDDVSKKRMIDQFINFIWTPLCLYATKCKAFSQQEEETDYRKLTTPLLPLVDVKDHCILFTKPLPETVLLRDLPQMGMRVAAYVKRMNSTVGCAFKALLVLCYSHDNTPYGKMIAGIIAKYDLDNKTDPSDRDIDWEDIADEIRGFVANIAFKTTVDSFLAHLTQHHLNSVPIDKRSPSLNTFISKTVVMQAIINDTKLTKETRYDSTNQIKRRMVDELWCYAVGLRRDIVNKRTERTIDLSVSVRDEELYC